MLERSLVISVADLEWRLREAYVLSIFVVGGHRSLVYDISGLALAAQRAFGLHPAITRVIGLLRA